MKGAMAKIADKALPLLVSLFLIFQESTSFILAEELVISGNGSGLDNTVSVQVSKTSTVEQTNQASVENNVNSAANTGGNSASQNSGGQVSITTGDIKQETQVENSLNSSTVQAECCPSSTSVVFVGNGPDSSNTVNLKKTENTSLTVNQTANIVNNISGSSNTGANSVNSNTGSVSIETGNIWASGQVRNVLVNTTSIKGGLGTGDIQVKLSGNGSGSKNSLSLLFDNFTKITTDYKALVFNNIYWDLNTGENSANGNIGDVRIKTGDIFFEFQIQNGPINFGEIFFGCCDVFDPGTPPKDEEKPPKEETPPVGGGGEDKKDEGKKEEGGGVSAGVVIAAAAGGPTILGLSPTGGVFSIPLYFIAGLLTSLLGLRITTEEVFRNRKRMVSWLKRKKILQKTG